MKTGKYFRLRIGVILLCLGSTFLAAAQHFVPDSKKSSVSFSVYSHKGGDNIIKGLFTTMKGDIFFDPKQLGRSFFDIAVTSASIFTQSNQRDKDLKGPAFFAVLKYPEIKIKSASITSDGKVIYILQGNLSIKGITKPVKIQFTATPLKEGYLFRGSFQVNRLLYNIGEKGDIDNMVTIFVEIKADKK